MSAIILRLKSVTKTTTYAGLYFLKVAFDPRDSRAHLEQPISVTHPSIVYSSSQKVEFLFATIG